MIRVRLGGKKERALLRPLTEKEIRQKLYGGYQEEFPSRVGTETEVLEPPKKARSFIIPPIRKSSVSFPWRKVAAEVASKIVTLSGKTFQFLLRFSQLSVKQVGTGWGLSVLIAVFLFASVYALNEYRAKAMKTARVSTGLTSTGQRGFRRSLLSKREPRVSMETAPLEAPPTKEIPPITSLKKPFVIQVCIYNREEDAKNLAEQIAQSQFPAFLQPFHRSNAKTLYPVFIGRFETFSEAQSELEQFRKKPIARDFSDSFVRTL